MANYHYSQQGQHPTYHNPLYNQIPRTSSFDAGDDVNYFEGEVQAGQGQHTYDNVGNAGSQHVTSSTYPALPTRTSTNPAAPTVLTGYHHTTASSQQYNPQAYSSPQTPYSGLPLYQPYVPAAYSETNLQRHPSGYAAGVGSPQSYYQPTSPPPPPPPRPNDSSYVRQPPYGVYQPEQRQPTYPYPSSTSQPSYSPPAPAPPPHNYGLPQPYSHTPSYATRTPSIVQQGRPPVSSYQPPDSHIASYISGANTQPGLPAASPPYQPTPPSGGISHAGPHRSDTHIRHPQARPLPGPPSDSESEQDYFGMNNGSSSLSGHENRTYGEVGKQINATQTSYTNAAYQNNAHDQNLLFPSESRNPLLTPDEVPTHANGNFASSGGHNINYGAFSDDSDAEAAAGLAAMQAAEEQEAAEEARRRSGSASLFSAYGSNRPSQEPPSLHDVSSSENEYANVDMGLVGGGYAGHMHYGEQQQSNYASAAAMPSPDYNDRLSPRMNSTRSTGMSSEGHDSHTTGYDSIPAQDALHPFPPFRTDVARVDTGGTGGLTEPSPHPRRLSFEDGDEDGLLELDNRYSSVMSPSRDSFQDLFYHPGMSPQRPLPPAPSNSDPGIQLPHLMPVGAYANPIRHSQYEQPPRLYPSAPDAYQQSLLSPSQVPRSTSLSSARSAPKPDQPTRAKTDAEARARLLRAQASSRPMSDVYESSTPQSAVALDLPTIPRKKFNPSKLSPEQFKKCSEPWALSSVMIWLKDLAEEESDLKEHALAEAIVALFTHKVPTMNTADAETLSSRVVEEMIASGTLVKEEEWVKFGPGIMSGVLFQLTGTGCYSSKLHLHHTKGRCYSYHCMRTLKKVDLSLASGAEKKAQDWATFYNLKKADIEDKPKKEVERQNVLHEIVTSEDLYISHLDVVRHLYRDQLAAAQPPIISEKKLASFLQEVFGHFDQVKKVNEDYLLAQLKYRQNEQGPWVVGFSDIFREWIRRAKSVYVEFAGSFPRANYLVRREMERNLLFKNFLDQAREDKRSERLSWDTYLKDPITRLQRYALLLQTVLKNMPTESEEKMSLQFAVDEVRAATFECNSKVAEMERKISLLELSNKIRLRKGMEREVELNLDHLGREVIIRGDLQRAGGKGFAWVDTHAILFDHYLVLAKTVIQRDSAGGRRYEIYDVSKVPIPMDLIVLESTNDPPVVKSKVSGIGAVTTTVNPQRAQGASLGRTNTNTTGGPGTLAHSNTNTSFSSKDSKSMVTTTIVEQSDKDDKIMYPFRIKHLGKSEVYTLYAPSANNRQEWCEAIIEAKTRHAASLFKQNAEPFHLRVLADTAFAYDGSNPGSKRINIRGTPLDRAVKEAEQRYSGQGRPAPICRAAVNCATVFNQPYGHLMCAIGTDYGVYVSEYENPRGWTRVSISLRVHIIS